MVGLCLAASAPAQQRGDATPPAEATSPAAPAVKAPDVWEIRAGYHRRVLAVLNRVYEESAGRDEKWDEGVRDFFSLAVRWRFNATQRPTATQVRQAGKKLYDLGCRDGAMLTFYGSALDADNHRKSASAVLAEAEKSLEASAYPTLMLVDARLYLTSALYSWKQPGVDEARERMKQALLDFGRRPGELADEPRFVLETMREWLDWLSVQQAVTLCDQLAQSPEVDPWLASTLNGLTAIRWAWAVRGSGYANTVSPEQWDQFYEGADIARQNLEFAHRLHPDRPEPATGMITVALAGRLPEGQDERFWFDRVVAAQFDWYPAYDAYLWSLRPRWGGSRAQMLAFGEECRDTERYDTRVPYYHVKAILAIADDVGDFEGVLRDPELYAAARSTLKRLIDGPLQKTDAAWDRSALAALAVRAGKPEDAGPLLLGSDTAVETTATAGFRITPVEVVREVRAACSPAADQLRRVGAAAAAGEWSRVPGLLDEAYTACEGSDLPTREAVYCKVASGKMLAAFQQGESVPLRFEHEPSDSLTLPAWRAVAGAWNTNYGDKGVFGDPREGLQLISYAEIGSRWELSGKIRFNSDGKNKRGEAGIIFGYDADTADEPRFLSCRLAWPANVLFVGYGLAQSKVAEVAFELDKDLPFKFQFWDDSIAFYLEDKLLYNGPAWKRSPNSAWVPGARFGFGGNSYSGDGIPTFSDMTLRKLSKNPWAELPSPSPVNNKP